MFCSYCGRNNFGNCKCLKSNPLNKLEALIVLVFFQFITFTIIYILSVLMSLDFKQLIPYVSLNTFLFLTALSVITLFGKKSYLASFFGCHQAIHRSIIIKGKALNICSRCFGIMVGLLFTGLLIFITYNLIIFILISLPLIIDGLYQKNTTYESNNLKRFITGALFSPLFAIIITGVNLLIIFSINLIIGGV